MKKIVAILAALLLITGCSDAYAEVKNSVDFVKVGNDTISSEDIYPSLVEYYGIEYVINFIHKVIYDAEVTDYDLQARIDEEIAKAKETDGDEYYKTQGFDTEDEYLVLITDVLIYEAIIKNYVNTNFENLVNSYLPVKMRVADFTDKETAEQAIKELKAGEGFNDVLDGKFTELYKGEEKVYSTLDTLPSEVVSYAMYADRPNIPDSPISTSDGRFYVVQITNTDPETFKEDIVDSFINHSPIIQGGMNYYTNKLGITFHDKAIHDLLLDSYPEYFGNN